MRTWPYCSGMLSRGRCIAGLTGLALAACSGSSRHAAPTPSAPMASVRDRPVAVAPAGPVPKVRGVYKVGNPYVVNGEVYVPAENPGYSRIGIASWYGSDFHGKPTANGELFDMNVISAAHPTLPLPSYVYVTNLRNGR